MERRLAAILAADMVGYSWLMASDEAGTLARQLAHRKELIDPKIAEYGGHLVKSTGDGVLVEFSSVVDALCCAVTIQLAMKKREEASPEEKRIAYRIGINLGDIIIKDDDIYGDGVNVAARVEALADPGGISVSRTVVDHVRGKVASEFEDQGEQQVKNIPDPVHVYRVLMQPEVPGKSAAQSGRMVRWARPAVGIAAILVIMAIGLTIWQPWAPDIVPASVERMAFVLPDKPSLAVLPFDNMSDDPQQEYFADGLTEDLITDLSKISGLFVIARNSTFTYKNTPTEVREVAEDLGVRYVLEGSVRRAGGKVRINAQLIDATTGNHVWAERYDGSVVDVFSVQDEFVRKIVKALAVNLTEEEQEEIGLGKTSNIEARKAFQKGWESFLRYSPEDNAAAINQFKTALELDPKYGRAYAAAGLAYLRGCQLRWHEPLGMTVSEANSQALAMLQKTKDNPSTLAHVAGSGINLYNQRYDEAATEATRAIAQDPNDPEGFIAMAWVMITTGKAEPGLELVERAMRLNPTYPNYYELARGTAYIAMDNLDKAAGVFEATLQRDPGAAELLPALASTYAHLGKREAARRTLLRWMPGASDQELQRIPVEYHFPYKWSRESEIRNRLYDGLDIAVLPLETTVASLAEVLRHGNSSDRLEALRTLRMFGSKSAEAVPAVIVALTDEKSTVRAQAARLLGMLGPAAKDAVPALTAIQEEGFVGIAVANSLEKIAGK